MRIVWSPLALDRVTDVADYIRLDNPPAARRFVLAQNDQIAILTIRHAKQRFSPRGLH